MQNNTNIYNTLYINYLGLFNSKIKCHKHTLSYLWSATEGNTDVAIECHKHTLLIQLK